MKSWIQNWMDDWISNQIVPKSKTNLICLTYRDQLLCYVHICNNIGNCIGQLYKYFLSLKRNFVNTKTSYFFLYFFFKFKVNIIQFLTRISRNQKSELVKLSNEAHYRSAINHYGYTYACAHNAYVSFISLTLIFQRTESSFKHWASVKYEQRKLNTQKSTKRVNVY
jgi:predicted PurR-regulated permease PerM